MMTSLLSGAGLSGRSEHDLPVVRAVALGRTVLAAAATVALGLLGGAGAEDPLLWWIGLGWLPLSAVLAVVAVRRPGSGLTRIGGALGDVATISLVAVSHPGHGGVALGYGMAVTLAAYTSSRVAGLAVAGAAAGALAGVELAADPARRSGPAGVALAALALFVLVALVHRARVVHRSAEHLSAQAQGRAAAILAHVASSVVVTDRTGTVTTTNPAAARMVGRPTADLAGQPCPVVLGLHEGERPLDCSDGCALLGRGGPDGVELWRPRGPGRQPLVGSAEAVRDAEGEVVEVVHSFRDITAARQADEAKALFLATASHELRTPLTVIRGFAETLRRVPDIPDATRDAALEAIHRRAVELGQIVERLLLSSRIDAGRLDLLLAAVDVGALLHERLEAARDETGREVIAITDETLPSVRGDAVAVATVIDQLVDNAIKYSGDDTTVVVAARVEGDELVLSVDDSGIGMDGEQLAHCFDKFWQAESSDRRRYGGTGIGLYIVKAMVEAMGGRISVESAVGQGTTFTVRLDIHVDLTGDAGGATSTAASGNGPSVRR